MSNPGSAATSVEEINQHLSRVPRSDRLAEIQGLLLSGELPCDQLPAVVSAWWNDSEFPGVDFEAWVDLFDSAVDVAGRYISDTDFKLDGELVVYRGVSDPEYERGLSWTLDPQVACWFARRFALLRGEPRVFRTRVQAFHIYAYFTERQEDEIVADVDTPFFHVVEVDLTPTEIGELADLWIAARRAREIERRRG